MLIYNKGETCIPAVVISTHGDTGLAMPWAPHPLTGGRSRAVMGDRALI